jgi:formate hydrogenlyase subunit 4
MSAMTVFISPLAALILSPLMAGVINRVKAMVAGRKGPSFLQGYYDLFRLFRKGSVFSQTTSWIFRIAPFVIFAATVGAACFVPFLDTGTPLSFTGDLVVLFYLLGLGRFFLILSALDTGSAFEGMGASREAFFSALVEPVVFICLLNLMRTHGAMSVTTALSAPTMPDSVAVLLTAIPLFLVLLVENARIPFDDPTTHLELTMIHEVMILDNSGPGLALMEYAAAVKLWLFSLILGRILLPAASPWVEVVVLLALVTGIAVLVGLVESFTARLRLLKVPQLLFGAGVVALLGYFVSVTNVLSWVKAL